MTTYVAAPLDGDRIVEEAGDEEPVALTDAAAELVLDPSRLRREDGRLWTYPLDDPSLAGDRGGTAQVSRLALFEDDRRLGPSKSLHDDIRRFGSGRYSHWNQTLYLSTSDGSSPMSNGRRYVARLEPLDDEGIALRAALQEAFAIDDGTHARRGAARDVLLRAIALEGDPLTPRSELAITATRTAAQFCIYLGPYAKAVELLRGLVAVTGDAGDYAMLSEALTSDHGSGMDEALGALRKAMTLDPDRHATPANDETLRLSTQRQPERTRGPLGRFPEKKDFEGDAVALFTDYVAPELKRRDGFIEQDTRFFSMGSCFARSVARHLALAGHQSLHLELTEHVNTTFANRAFVDWLATKDGELGARFAELAPHGWNADETLRTIATSDVFVLTLGVAAAFFDRDTGAFVMPRASKLNLRALAETYRFRTTSVGENVDNVLHLVDFVRSLNPAVRIVITVSPVPMAATFEFESCIQADCLSKSTMRLVAHEVATRLPDVVTYWPSFEFFRWVGSTKSDFFGADDDVPSHVSDDRVRQTIEAFTTLCAKRDGST